MTEPVFLNADKLALPDLMKVSEQYQRVSQYLAMMQTAPAWRSRTDRHGPAITSHELATMLLNDSDFDRDALATIAAHAIIRLSQAERRDTE